MIVIVSHPSGRTHRAEVSSLESIRALVAGSNQRPQSVCLDIKTAGDQTIAFNQEGQLLGLEPNKAFPISYANTPVPEGVIVLGEQIPYLLGVVVLLPPDWESILD